MERHLLTRQDVATLARLSLRTIDEHVARGLLHPIRFGRSVRFTTAEVDRWVASHLKVKVPHG